MDSNKSLTATYQTPSSAYTLSVESAGENNVFISSTTGFSGTTNYSRPVNNGSLVILTAPATVAGKAFTGWTGSVNSSSQTIWFTMNSDKSVTANYDALPATYTLFVDSSGASNVPISSSTGHGGTTNYSRTVTEGMAVALTAPLAMNGSIFTGWTGAVISAGQTITLSMTENKSVTANKTVTANYETAPTGPTLSVSSSGASNVEITSLTGFEGTTNYTKTVNEGALVVLTAPSSWAGATFTGWTGAVTSSNTTVSLIMDSNKSVTATYQTPSSAYTLSVTSSGESNVFISSTTGFGGTTNYSRPVNNGSLVILTAPATVAGKAFTGWTGSVTSSSQTIWFTMNADKSVTANYDTLPATYALFVESSGASNVPISSTTGHGGTTNYSRTVTEGMAVALTAPLAMNGSIFTGWTGAVTSAGQTITLSMTETKSVTANYTDSVCIPSTVSVNSIVPDRQRGSRGRSFGTVTVTVFDNCGYAVANAQVVGTFTGDYNETLTATTNAQGVATFTTTTQAKKPAYTFCVDDIVKAGLTYNAGDNVETCDSY
jgi:type IV secretory pathway protease TraF